VTPLDLAILLGIMLALATLPSASVFLVVTRSAGEALVGAAVSVVAKA
jgi:hypothetical protein